MELNEILHRLAACGAAASGAVGRQTLTKYMTAGAVSRLEALLPGWRSVITAAFPYYVALPAPHGAVSRYAWGEDYHAVLKKRLEPIVEALRGCGAAAEALIDASPVPEREAAALSGLGTFGRNGLLIVPEYGSYVFLSAIVTDAVMEYTNSEISHCEDCGACIAACPTGALGADGFHAERCLSHISQKKGELTAEDAALLRENACVWGCDVCQEVCPHNASPRRTEIPELCRELTPVLTEEMFRGLSNREFMRRYGNRAWSWRGVGVLRRNLRIVNNNIKKGETNHE